MRSASRPPIGQDGTPARREVAADRELAAAVDALRRILRQLRVTARKTELAAGLSAAQAFVLTTVQAQPLLSVNEVAAATMTDRSSAAAVIDRLTDLGFVSRTTSNSDRRRAEISITTRGRAALRRTAPPPTAILIAAIRGLSNDDRSQLAAGLTALAQGMGVGHEPAGMLFEDGAPRRAGRRRRPRHG